MYKVSKAIEQSAMRDYQGVIIKSIIPVNGQDIYYCINCVYPTRDKQFIEIVAIDGTIKYSLELPIFENKKESSILRIIWSNMKHHRQKEIDSEFEKTLKEMILC